MNYSSHQTPPIGMDGPQCTTSLNFEVPSNSKFLRVTSTRLGKFGFAPISTFMMWTLFLAAVHRAVAEPAVHTIGSEVPAWKALE
jgi:hypothetical protein